MRHAWLFCAPEHDFSDLTSMDPSEIGENILQLGRQLYDEGSLPEHPTWAKEESPEFEDSLNLWEQAVQEDAGPLYTQLVQRAFRQAEAAYFQMGRLEPRLSALRWCMCMCWLASRSALIIESSPSGQCNAIDPKRSMETNLRSKQTIFGWLKNLVKEPKIMAIYDFDLVGNGIWHSGGRESVPEDFKNEWARRGVEFDIARMCAQAMLLEPESANAAAPRLRMVQPLGTADLQLLLPHVPRLIMEKHGWVALERPLPFEEEKFHVDGPLLHIEVPLPPEPDLTNPEVYAKLERGEDLGKGLQEDGLPGALHGSVGLLYAAACYEENISNIQMYIGALQLDGFFRSLLRYGPIFRNLSFADVVSIPAETLQLLGLVGNRLHTLDLQGCGINQALIEDLANSLVFLPNLRRLDLANNQMETAACLKLISELCERRIDIDMIRLDGNPLGNPEIFRNEVAGLLAQRGESAVAGGEIVFHLGDSAVRWCSASRPGCLAHTIREDAFNMPMATSFKELRRVAEMRKKRLKSYEENDPAAKSSGGRDWLMRQRATAQKILENSVMSAYKSELLAVRDKEEPMSPTASVSPKSP